MKRFITFLLIPFLFTIGLFAQNEKTFDTSIGETEVEFTGIISDGPVSYGGPLLSEGVLETTFSDFSGNLHPFSIAFDGTFYYVVGGGGSSGEVALLDASFNLIATQEVALDCRSVFYNPADGNIYIKGYTDNGLYRLNTSPFNGGFDVVFTNLFQDNQSKACISPDGSLLYDHFNGNVVVYDFATGLTVDNFSLDLQHNLDWPRGNLIAHTGTYLITIADNVIYAYDPANGNSISSCTLTSMPTSYEWSMSYTNGMFFLTEDTESTWYVWVIDDGAVSVDDNGVTVFEYSLEQNYPNPFNPSTKIKYQIPKSSFVTLKVYDLLGKEIATLVSAEKPTGIYEIEFNANNLPSGIYFSKLQAGDFVDVKKMVLMK